MFIKLFGANFVKEISITIKQGFKPLSKIMQTIKNLISELIINTSCNNFTDVCLWIVLMFSALFVSAIVYNFVREVLNSVENVLIFGIVIFFIMFMLVCVSDIYNYSLMFLSIFGILICGGLIDMNMKVQKIYSNSNIFKNLHTKIYVRFFCK